MNPRERHLVAAGLDVLSNMVGEVSPELSQNRAFTTIAQAALALAKGLVQNGHADPAAELQRLRQSIEGAWQDALDAKFRQG
jgi:hypothetical protein